MGTLVECAGTTDMGDGRLEIRLLGELQILRDGRTLGLPASKKTRALLGYLAATGMAHRRERLCDLLWDGPDDPRGELRWSLSKIRPLLDDAETARLQTDRLHVAFDARGAAVDLATLRSLLADGPGVPLAALEAAVGLFRGEFLDGLDLPTCYRFQEWCLAEREAASALRLAALGALVDRLRDRPDEALVHARALVAADPLSEEAHAGVVGLLGRLGRRREALAQYEQARCTLARELGAPLSGALDRALRRIAPRSSAPAGSGHVGQEEEGSRAGGHAAVPIPFVGRHRECTEVDRLIAEAAGGSRTPLLLLTGEPGIGKSRLLDHLADRVVSTGGLCLKGRAFEAEVARAYGAWLDALRVIPVAAVPADARENLALIRPELGPLPAAPTDRAGLFDAVLSVLQHVGRQRPLAIVLDDLQWLDEASSSLLHYAARALDAPGGVLFACAARPGELADNPPVARMLQALERERRLLELRLVTLSEAETAELARAVDPGIDAAAVFRESDGNPLFILELSRTHREGRHQPGRSLGAVITHQLGALDEPARSLIAWAAALGRAFRPDLLGRASGLEPAQLLATLETLERRAIIRTTGEDAYDFVHDLVRQAAYQAISQPRRKLMHRQIARALEAMVATDDGVAGDLAHQAELAGDPALATRACVMAGERSLRLFANAEASALARRGRSHIDRLPDDLRRRELMIGLLKIEVLAAAGPGMRPLPQVAGEVREAVARAEEAGLHAAATTGHYLLSVLYQEAGDLLLTHESVVRAALAGRSADRATRGRQLANSARCLIELEAEIPVARDLLREAESALGTGASLACEVQWGYGLLRRWEGCGEAAAARVERAFRLAGDAQDRWREFKCLTWLAIIDLELGRHAQASRRCEELRAVSRRLGEEDAPIAAAVAALAGLAGGGDLGLARLEAALRGLRIVDDKTYLAYALNAAALHWLRRQRPAQAEAYAGEALEVAAAVRRPNEILIAEALLARATAGLDPRAAGRRIARLAERAADGDRFSARTRAVLAQVASAPAAWPRGVTRGDHKRGENRCRPSSSSAALRRR